MNARIAAFLQALASQMAHFYDNPDLRAQLSSADAEKLAALSCMDSDAFSTAVNAIAQTIPLLDRLAQNAPDFVMLYNEANAILAWAGIDATNNDEPLIERLCALNHFFENENEDYTAIRISNNGDVHYGLGLSLHDGSLATYLSQMPHACGMSNDAFYEHFFGDKTSSLRDAVEEGQTALASFFEERFILRYDPILCRKVLQLPEDIESGLKLIASHPQARQLQRRQVIGRRFEATRNDAIRIGMKSLRGFALMFDANPVKTEIDQKIFTGISDTDKCLTLADAMLSKMHGHLAAHWQNRFENIVEGHGVFEGKNYDETHFLGSNADKRPWKTDAFAHEDAPNTPELRQTEISLSDNNSVTFGDRTVGPLDPMTREQRALFVENLKNIQAPHLTQAVEMPEGWTILCQNIPLFLSERCNELNCSRFFQNADHALEIWVKRLAAQIRGDVLLDDFSARALPLGTVDGQPLRRRWFRAALTRLMRDPKSLPIKGIIRATQHAVDVYDNYDGHVLRLEYDDFRAMRQQPHRRLSDYIAAPVVQMQALTALWFADFQGVAAEIPVPPLARSTQSSQHRNDEETLFRVAMGTPVYPSARGQIVACGKIPHFDNTIIIRHPNDLYSRYTHLATIGVTPGDVVQADTMIARSGMTLNGPALGFAFDAPSAPVKNWSDFGSSPLELPQVFHTYQSHLPMPEMIIQ